MKILCGTDFSEPAKAATEVAAHIAEKLKLPLRLVHCVADWLAPAEYSLDLSEDELGRELLDAESVRVASIGQKTETEILHGSASHHLIAEGNDDAALVVMGATGKGIAGRLFLGSVAEQVSEAVSVPTLVVRDAKPLLQWLNHGAVLKVLCATDVSESESALLSALMDLLPMGPYDLECAHFVQMNAKMVQGGTWMVEHSDCTTPRNAEASAIQEGVKRRFGQMLGLEPRQVHVLPSWGNPAYDLVALAERTQADLIVVGSHHRHGFQRLKHPSFSRRVLAHGHTNVLCVYLGESGTEAKASHAVSGRVAEVQV